MRLQFRINAVQVIIDADDIKDIMRQLSAVSEVFAHNKCGQCGSENTYPIVRNAKGYEFFEMHCRDCGASLQFGQTKEGGRLFAKGGWETYRGPNE